MVLIRIWIIPAVGFLFLLCPPLICFGIRSLPSNGNVYIASFLQFSESPAYRNGVNCPSTATSCCDPSLVHVAMTLDFEYLRGTIAAVHSILRHASCPERIFLHFIATESPSHRVLTRLVRSVFPSLNHKVYAFPKDRVSNLISSSIRTALENPLNYARNYLGELLEPCVKRVIYLDSDLILVDDISELWEVTIPGGVEIGAPEYCHANFTKYFTDSFWSDPELSRVFGSRGRRKPCYFNTGVMVMDLERWREGHFGEIIEQWMELQGRNRIYELGSLPPFLLVFGGKVEPIDHRWNQHGLGGDNAEGSCRALHPGAVSLLHWSGKGKPWMRLDGKRPCPLDQLWARYDLYRWKLKEHVQSDQRCVQHLPARIFTYLAS